MATIIRWFHHRTSTSVKQTSPGELDWGTLYCQSGAMVPIAPAIVYNNKKECNIIIKLWYSI